MCLHAFLNVGQCFIFLNSRNLLSVLPKYLFKLPLKVLLVSNNKLANIPEEIGKAKELMELVSSAYVLLQKNFYVLYSRPNPTSYFVASCRMWAVMRSRRCQLRWGDFKPYENSTSERIVFICCLRVSPTFLFHHCAPSHRHPLKNHIHSIWLGCRGTISALTVTLIKTNIMSEAVMPHKRRIPKVQSSMHKQFVTAQQIMQILCMHLTELKKIESKALWLQILMENFHYKT